MSRRLDAGGHGIDRSRPLRFVFDGAEYEGCTGDTLASALIANGVDVVCPSPILGRPRGVMTAGVEEPSAFVGVLEPWTDVIAPAPAVELVDGLVTEGRPGVGRLPDPAAPAPPAHHRHAHVETLVIGGGQTGLAAAAGSPAGERVLLVDERPWLGGTSSLSDRAAESAGASSLAALEARPDTTLLTRATALGLYDDGYVVVHERGGSEQRLWHVRARRVILATGAHERPIAFANNDRPGVMLASAVRQYVERFGLLAGERAVLFTTNDDAYATAWALQDAGATVVAVADVRTESPMLAQAAARGVEVLPGWAVTGTDGSPRVSAVHLSDGTDDRTVTADLVAVSGGWNPAVQLARAIGAGMRFDDDRACFVPDASGPEWLRIVGAAAGDVAPSAPCWYVHADDLRHHFVDFQRDQSVADVLASLDRGLRSVEHVKRDTYIGTAVDQGRTSGVLTAEIVNQTRGETLGAQGPTNARPPYTPVSYAALAGRNRGMLLDPVRRTPIHPWHLARGAAFENVGQWHRPWYFPLAGEDLDAAVHREGLAVRTAAGALDASTLGKIEVVGPDVGEFLDRMYTNAMSSLAVGSIRYGLMLGLDGMVMDDGTASRLAQDRYLVTTTTGGAATVLDHFEEWLQTEWPHLRVHCTSVTEQWSTIAVTGPRAREVLAAANTGLDLSTESFPFMTWREGSVAGARARVCRISFTGELSYEINVPGTHGLATWEAILAAGEPLGLVPYGTETMHVLRAEKGFVIVGQDTDGTVTPEDLGMSWIVNQAKGDFVGRRSLRRPDTVRPDRKQLVGLLTQDPDALLPEGAQLVLGDPGGPPTATATATAMAGHVTSSYRSPVLGHSIALALIAGGRSLHGSTVHAPLPGGTIAATVTEPVFYDPEGARRDG